MNKKDTKPTYQGPRRNENDKVVAGVCSGIAKTFNVDVSLIRLGFVLFTLFGGSGILLYIVLWIIMPSNKKSSEINKETIKENLDDMKQNAQKFVENAKSYGENRQNAKYVLGIALLLFGMATLMQNLGFLGVIDFGKFWPIFLIIVGFIILSKKD